jgi:dihydrofolate reductase
MQDAMATTGSVIMGRRTFDMGNGDYAGYEYQVPIFVVTHHAPEQPTKGQNENLKFHFVADGVESAVRQAKTAAGKRDVVVVGGPDLIRQLMQARLVDEVQLGIMPVMLGEGLPYFRYLGIEPIELEKTRLIESPGGRTDIYFRVKK